MHRECFRRRALRDGSCLKFLPDKPFPAAGVLPRTPGSDAIAAVKRGKASLRRGAYLTHDEVGERLKRFLQPS